MTANQPRPHRGLSTIPCSSSSTLRRTVLRSEAGTRGNSSNSSSAHRSVRLCGIASMLEVEPAWKSSLQQSLGCATWTTVKERRGLVVGCCVELSELTPGLISDSCCTRRPYQGLKCHLYWKERCLNIPPCRARSPASGFRTAH